MSITISPEEIKFNYKSKNWKYHFDEIKKLGLLKKKRNYFAENTVFVIATFTVYYCMLFSDLMALYYIVPTLLSYLFIIIMKFNNDTEFVYFVFVKDIYKNEIKTKIAVKDHFLIAKQIDKYLDLQFERNIRKMA